MSSGHDFLRRFGVARSTRPADAYAGGIVTHYDVLGIPPDATPDRIRAAYRDLARRHHPDRGRVTDVALDESAATAATAPMAAVNEAYRVLGDAGRRAIYDHSLASGPPVVDSSEFDDLGDDDPLWSEDRAVAPSRLMPAGPARMPWRMMLVAAVLGSAVILFAASFNDPPSSETPDGILRTGSCVEIESNGDVREIACTNIDDITVELVVPTGAVCPGGLGAYRDRLGLGTVCIEID